MSLNNVLAIFVKNQYFDLDKDKVHIKVKVIPEEFKCQFLLQYIFWFVQI